MTSHPAAEAPLPIPDEAAEAEAPVGPRLYGVIDVLRADRIAGWAIDRTDSAAALEIDIVREGAVVRTVRADRPRADLEKGGVGTGAYGFRAEIEPPLEPGLEFTLGAVARAPDGASAALGRVGAAQRAPDPATRLLERLFTDVARLAAAADRPAAQPPSHLPAHPPAPDAALADALARVEVVQARLEAVLGGLDAPPPPPRDRSLTLIVAVTFATALVSLGVGIASLVLP